MMLHVEPWDDDDDDAAIVLMPPQPTSIWLNHQARAAHARDVNLVKLANCKAAAAETKHTEMMKRCPLDSPY